MARAKGMSLGKAFLPFDGKPLVFQTLAALRGAKDIMETILVVSPPSLGPIHRRWNKELRALGVTRIVAGGETRQDSVRIGLAGVSPQAAYVLVHDAVRPLIRPRLIREVLKAARKNGAAIAAVPAIDSVKRVGRDLAVEATLDRKKVWFSQTPQVFLKELLVSAHERARVERYTATDDAELVERMGYIVRVVEGDRENMKVTTPHDLSILRKMKKEPRKSS